jgi:hypothetical protein
MLRGLPDVTPGSVAALRATTPPDITSGENHTAEVSTPHRGPGQTGCPIDHQPRLHRKADTL